jgi:hypothetical protein
MKKFLLSIIAIVSITGAFAQSRYQGSNNGRIPATVKSSAVNMNELESISLPGKNSFKTLGMPDTFISRHGLLTNDSNAYVWLNMLHDTVLTDRWRFMTVWFDSLHDSDPAATTYFPYGNSADSIIIDSLYAFVSHKKTSPSSVIDTIEFRVIDFAGTALWTGYKTTTTNLFNGNLTGSGAVGLVRMACGFVIPTTVSGGIGVSVRFRGATPQDSFMTLATYPKKGTCTLGNRSAKVSRFIDNSYLFLGKVDTSSTSTPSYANFFAPADLLYYNDCNNNSQQDTTPNFYNSNELFELQNAEIFLLARRVDRSPVSVINTIDDGQVRVYPNPSSGLLNVTTNFQNSIDVSVKLTDVTGKVVMSQNLGNLSNDSRSLDISNLNSGVYIFELSTSNGKSIQKIVKN